MDFIETISAAYGLAVERAVPARGGWTAEAYLLETCGGRFFLKIYDKRRPSVRPWIERMDRYLPVMVRLSRSAELGPRLPRLRPARDGRRQVETENRVFLLFDFIDGPTLDETPLTAGQAGELAEILAGLHNFPMTDPVENQALAEDLTLPFLGALAGFFSRPAALPAAPGKIIAPRAAALSAALDLTARLNRRRRESRPPTVLCHTDAHHGNLMQSGRLMLLDWEGLALAPAEADLFMPAGEPRFEAFLKVYGEHRPGFVLNRELLHYYRLRRKLEDVFEFIVQLVYDQPEPAAAEEALGHLERECAEIAALPEEFDGAV